MRWWERIGAWDDTHRFATDATGVLILVILVLMLAPTTAVIGTTEPGIGHVFAIALTVPLAWRRTRPVASAATVFVVALVQLVTIAPLIIPSDLVVLVALYSITVHGPTPAYRAAATGAVLGSLAFGAELVLKEGPGGVDGAVVGTFVLILLSMCTFAFGLVLRSRRVTLDALVDRAQRLEMERDQQTQIATAAERARIAREMHDIVAHSLSVIIAQADGGHYAAKQDPGAAERSLATIAETGRAALADMRRLLGVLRPAPSHATTGSPATSQLKHVTAARGASAIVAAGRASGTTRDDGSDGGALVADLVPQPAVDDITVLVAQIRDSGVHVSLVHMGTPRALPPGTGLTVYRICQESLTNILKHAGPDPKVTVLLQWSAASLILEVTDDGRGAAAESDGGGQGVLGMRERAAMLGGTLAVGPRPGGGFRVRAEIPTPRLPGSDPEETA